MCEVSGRQIAEQLDAQEVLPWCEQWARLRTRDMIERRRIRALEGDKAREHIRRRRQRERLTR